MDLESGVYQNQVKVSSFFCGFYYCSCKMFEKF